MTHPIDNDLASFCSGFGGQALTPGQPEYDTARAIWNGAIDRKPAVIAYCRTAAQVADAIRFARGRGLELSIRGGGHNYAGHAVCEGGMMIHLGAMNDVLVDPVARRAICGGGATWADVDAGQPSGTASRRPAASSATPASPVSRSAAASAGSRRSPACLATTSSPRRS